MASGTLQTLVIMWVLTWLAMAIMALRLIMRKARGQKFDISDYVTMMAMFCLMTRNGMIHVVLQWGTNDVSEAFRTTHYFTAEEIYQREVGSKLAITNRVFYSSYIWLQKCVVMCLYRRLLCGLRWVEGAMKCTWGILAATYVVIQVVTFTECQPLYLYWQVLPDPGVCAQALLQLIVLGALDILTDVILLVLPMPNLCKTRRSMVEKIQLILLFSVGALCVVVIITRLPINYTNGAQQVNRTTWESVEALAAAFVANIPTLYSFRRRAPDPKRTGYGNGSRSHQFYVSAAEFMQVSDHGITVTKSIEMHDQKLAAPINQHEYLDAWAKQNSREGLVGKCPT